MMNETNLREGDWEDTQRWKLESEKQLCCLNNKQQLCCLCAYTHTHPHTHIDTHATCLTHSIEIILKCLPVQ